MIVVTLLYFIFCSLQDPFVQLLSGYLQQKMVTSRGAEVCIYMLRDGGGEGGREGGREGVSE